MGVYKRGDVYWFKFVFNGQRIQRSSKVTNRKDATDIERAYRTNLARGEVGIEDKPKQPTFTIGQLLDALEAHYTLVGKASRPNLSSISTARKEFSAIRADALSEERVESYIGRRLAAGAKNATINRITGILARAYKLSRISMPEVRHLSEKDNARTGFFTFDDFEAVVKNLPADLQDFARFGFVSGWRKGEIASLRWSDVEEGIIRLRSTNSKNGEARQITIEGDLVDLMKRRRALRSTETSGGAVMNAFIFHRDGKSVREFRKSWARACVATGQGTMTCPKCEKTMTASRCSLCKIATNYRGRIFHDLRRSAVRNMIRAGVPQSVAMKISGHKTASMFRRYDIANEGDLRQAMLSVQKYRETERQKLVNMTTQ